MRCALTIGLAVSVVLLAPGAARAQATSAEHPVVGGLRAGVVASSWRGSDQPSPHLGLALAAFVSLRRSARLTIQPELVLCDRGAGFTGPGGDAADEALLFVELPVLLRHDWPLTELAALYGVAGPGVAFLLDSKRTPKGDLANVDVTVTGGVGVDLYTPKHYISVDVRAGFGLRDLRPDARSAHAYSLTVLAGVTL